MLLILEVYWAVMENGKIYKWQLILVKDENEI